ncbi:aromatic ring-hydroxylating oxygenase subunit alpha [Spelaeicoccus albus]|uniref:Rieske 2Fe-2S family protein n=1 Tax=Spelaeicoccus albus TaxID=1280376 RepID=A0A7Z0A9Q1_9MICO|nr:aromatic ring-hydroxylating dioxygenase subunit alpha [Spelaeicoccus albus]NYI66181.1 Rieske 2Fe-2S family protein [Spelaeicoccus albus]
MTTFAPPAGPVTGALPLPVRRRPGFSLEGPFYTSAEIFAEDIDRVFSSQWIFAGTEAEIPRTGDYLTVTFGHQSVIVIRDGDDVRAMHNVCRHRGTRLLDETCGTVGNIVCGYHKWTYRTNGELMFAPAQPPNFDKTCFALRSVHVRSLDGLIFICLAADPPADIDTVAGLVSPYLAPHGLKNAKVAARSEIVEHGNWKLVMENNRECYHCDNHPELICTFFPTYGYEPDEIPPNLLPAYDRFLAAENDLHAKCDAAGLPYEAIEELDGRDVGFRIQRESLDGAGESFSADGSAVCRRSLGGFTDKRLGRLSMHVQPNFWSHVLSDHAVVFSVLPLTVSTTVVRTTWLVDAEAEEGIDYDLDELTTVWNHTNEQDGEIVARAQLGVSSPAYEPGPYAPSEYQVEKFCSWYIDAMNAGEPRPEPAGRSTGESG